MKPALSIQAVPPSSTLPTSPQLYDMLFKPRASVGSNTSSQACQLPPEPTTSQPSTSFSQSSSLVSSSSNPSPIPTSCGGGLSSNGSSNASNTSSTSTHLAHSNVPLAVSSCTSSQQLPTQQHSSQSSQLPTYNHPPPPTSSATSFLSQHPPQGSELRSSSHTSNRSSRSNTSAALSDSGFNIRDTGTLEIELHSGLSMAISPRGTIMTPPSNTSTPSSTGGRGASPRDIGWIRMEDLKIGHVIGQGAQSVIRKVKHVPSGKVYAMKSLDLHTTVADIRKTMQMELSRLVAMSHPNIVSYCGAFFENRKLRVVIEYMNQGSLSRLINKYGGLPTAEVAAVTFQLMTGIDHLHRSGIVHRDLKPSNLLVNSQGQVKIADFGVATVVLERDGVAKTRVGSTAYMSPERIRGCDHGTACDIWGCGVCCAECALGVYPFRTELIDATGDLENLTLDSINMFDLEALIAEDRAVVLWDILPPLIPNFCIGRPQPDVSDLCQNFVTQCIAQDPALRWSSAQLLDHPFIGSVGSNAAAAETLKLWITKMSAATETNDEPK